MFRWYVINTYSGHENKVKQNLEHRVSSLGQTRAVRQVVVPTETVQEMKDNQKISVEKRTMPGYVLVNMDLNEDSWQVVKGTPGVTGFVGASNEPIPLTQAEVDRLLHREVAVRAPSRAQFYDRRVRQGHLRPAVGLLGRDLRDQRGRGEAEGAGIYLRARDARRGRLRPGEEDLDHGQESSDHNQAAGPWRPGVPGSAGRPGAGPARHQHHGVRQGVQRPDAERHGHHDPGRDHGLRGPLVHVRHEDAAGRRPDPPGDRHREGLG